MPTRIADPTAADRRNAHFSHCDSFMLIHVDDGAVTGESGLVPPAHQPGTFPRFLTEQGVGVVFAGGMGIKAQALFQQSEIEVHTGLMSDRRDRVDSDRRDELQAGGHECDQSRYGQHSCREHR